MGGPQAEFDLAHGFVCFNWLWTLLDEYEPPVNQWRPNPCFLSHQAILTHVPFLPGACGLHPVSLPVFWGGLFPMDWQRVERKVYLGMDTVEEFERGRESDVPEGRTKGWSWRLKVLASPSSYMRWVMQKETWEAFFRQKWEFVWKSKNRKNLRAFPCMYLLRCSILLCLAWWSWC